MLSKADLSSFNFIGEYALERLKSDDRQYEDDDYIRIITTTDRDGGVHIYICFACIDYDNAVRLVCLDERKGNYRIENGGRWRVQEYRSNDDKTAWVILMDLASTEASSTGLLMDLESRIPWNPK